MTICSTSTWAPAFAKKAWDSQRAYATRIGADYVQRLSLPLPKPMIGGASFVPPLDLPDDEPCLWLDWDVLVTRDAVDNIFDHCPESGIALPEFERWGPMQVGAEMRCMCPSLPPVYHNIGVMLGRAAVFRQIRDAVTPAMARQTARIDLLPARQEAVILLAIAAAGVPVTDLPPRFHATAPGAAAGASFIHYLGQTKAELLANLS